MHTNIKVTPIRSRSAPTYTRRDEPAYASKTTYKSRTSAYHVRKRDQSTDMTAKSSITRKKTSQPRKKKLALLLPAHNEELIIGHTIRSAMKAGLAPEDIYVSDDGSEDNTRKEALKLLSKKNVLTSPKGGKAQAVIRGIKEFKIEERYVWVHVADADSVFSPDYFRVFKRNLDAKKYAIALGFVQSLRGNWISTYRAFIYTFGQHIVRRIQSWFGMISVFPGAITCFRTDIIKDLDFTAHSLTEDFDLTLQVHRKKLGNIKFIPEAVNYTQDPLTLRDFIKQNLRWQRGFFQGVAKYKVGLKGQRVDFGLGYVMLELLLYLVQMFVVVPYLVITTHNYWIIPLAIFSDFIAIATLALFSATVTKRLSIMLNLPGFYFLRWVEIGVIAVAYFEVMCLHKFKSRINGWETKGRRYALDTKALKDTV